MTEDTLRERLVALEVEMRHLRESSARQADELRELRETVGALRDLLTQARGARVAIVFAIGAGSFFATYAPMLVKWLWAVK